MSDFDQWWNAPSEGKSLTEDDLRQALDQWHKHCWKPEPRYVRDEEGRWMIVMIPSPQKEESR